MTRRAESGPTTPLDGLENTNSVFRAGFPYHGFGNGPEAVGMRSARILLILAPLVACGGGGAGGRAPDTVSTRDLGVGSDVRLLPDAVVLEPGAPDFSPGSSADDPGPWVSPDASTMDLGQSDAPGDLPLAEDLADSPDPPSVADGGVPADPGTLPDADAPIAGRCGSPGAACGPGMACLPDDETGIPRCRFVAECSDEGVVEAEDFFDFFVGSTSLYIKVKARVWVGPAACTMMPCPANDPCCNACFAPLVAGNKKFPILLLGQGVTFGCQGSECDYSLACSPMKPDAWYLIWGTISLIGGEAQLFVDSFCPATPD